MPNKTYKKTERIATGGSADVYLVYDERLEAERIIKVLKADCSEETRKRLQTEAKIAAKLRHPNIVETYGAGKWDNGAPYIEMEYISGDSVEHIIEQNPEGLPPKTALSVAHGVSQALRYLADLSVTIDGREYRGLIHRDIKPSNILIVKTDAAIATAGGIPKLIDFGVSRPEAVSLHTSHAGAPIGTLAYMAPEQFDGKKIDCGVDIYALGAVLYEMLTGQKAFPQDDVSTLLLKKMNGQYPPLKNPAYGGIAKIIKRCLAVNRKDRYATASDLCDAIEKQLRRLPATGDKNTLKRIAELCAIIIAAALYLKYFPSGRYAQVIRIIVSSNIGGLPNEQ